MAAKVYTIDTVAGIQRDGTVFDKNFYNDGEWVRFQRGRPRKIGGYRVMSAQMSGPSRGVWVNPQNNFNYVFSGYNNGLQRLVIDNNGVGAGIDNFTLNNFTESNLNLWQFDGFYDVAGSGNSTIVAHPGQNLTAIDSTANAPVLIGDVNGTSLSQIGVFEDTTGYLNSTIYVTFPAANTLIGAGQSVTGTGIPANTTVTAVNVEAPNLSGVTVTGIAGELLFDSTPGLYIGQTVTISGVSTGTATGLVSGITYYIVATNSTTTLQLSAASGGTPIVTTAGTTDGLIFTLGLYTKVTLSNAATSTSNEILTFNNNVVVSGGVVTLHPYVFVYGNNGLIKNCSAGNAQDWVSADANETNVATGKIIQGLPVRGGSNAPSGLFWSLDSLIRVSYIGGTGTPVQYWRYDIITSQSSILSSQSAIEYDGVYYWCGTDRFLLYNGVVKEIPNTMNQNYFFDNLNYSQRQKIWATKVPRYGEIWWFYPKGDATECTDAIIYNIRDNTWYDAGEAVGARRSAGYFSQVFAYPIAAGWDTVDSEEVTNDFYFTESGNSFIYSDTYNNQVALTQTISGSNIVDGSSVIAITSSNIHYTGFVSQGSSYVDGTYDDVPVIYETPVASPGFSAVATVIVSGGIVTDVTLTSRGAGYSVGDLLTVDSGDIGGAGSGLVFEVTGIYEQAIQMSENATGTGNFSLTFSTSPNRIKIYQHEFGTDNIDGQNVLAVRSSFETSDLGWVGGGPAQPAAVGENKWLRVERVEPDFLLSGEMSLYITGRPYAQADDATTGPYVFDPNTHKIDMKEQRREFRMLFVSDVAGGDYQLGKLLVWAEPGDVRGY
jgi:hypothetical protein